jgi:hypothetical protein
MLSEWLTTEPHTSRASSCSSPLATLIVEHSSKLDISRYFRLTYPPMPASLDLGDFTYWRARLVNLYDAFNAPPFGFYQMWHDRRNPMQWWTFWLAGFILILSTFFGIISSYTAFVQTTVAQKSYQLALLQACDQNHNDLIAKLCPG